MSLPYSAYSATPVGLCSPTRAALVAFSVELCRDCAMDLAGCSNLEREVSMLHDILALCSCKVRWACLQAAINVSDAAEYLGSIYRRTLSHYSMKHINGLEECKKDNASRNWYRNVIESRCIHSIPSYLIEPRQCTLSVNSQLDAVHDVLAVWIFSEKTHGGGLSPVGLSRSCGFAPLGFCGVGLFRSTRPNVGNILQGRKRGLW